MFVTSDNTDISRTADKIIEASGLSREKFLGECRIMELGKRCSYCKGIMFPYEGPGSLCEDCSNYIVEMLRNEEYEKYLQQQEYEMLEDERRRYEYE